MGIIDTIFKRPILKKTQTWQEFGGYNATFSGFGGDIYSNDVVRSCVRPLAEFTSKADAKCSDKQLERLLNNRPNMYMSGRDFLYKIRTQVELKNTAFIYIQRENGKVVGFWPLPYSNFEALEFDKMLFIKFNFPSSKSVTIPWEELAVVRKDYNKSDIAGDANSTIINTLELLSTADEGTANAIKSTANLRGILKSTKGMLSPESIKEQKDRFVKDYMSLENEGGIASLDASQEFTPITMAPLTASYDQIREYRERIYRYFGVNDDIIMSRMTAEQIETFYELRVEPFLVALSRELTSKIYTKKELAQADGKGNWITYEANKLQFASLDKKISLFREVVLYGGMTINEWRAGSNMAPLEGGDDPIRRLDAAPVGGEDDDE